MILGSHTASPGGRVPLLANSSKKRLKRMYEKQSPVPMPIWSPVPLSTFILTLIGVSLSSRKVRGGTGLHIGIGTGLCFSYILFNRFFEEFAKSGTLPPGLAVWLPNIIYLFIAVYLYRKAPK